MTIAIKPLYRAILIGIAAAALLIGAFLLGSGKSPATAANGSAMVSTSGTGSGGVLLTAPQAAGKITVTGTGTVTGTPDELVLSMGVQTSASSVSIALRQANEAATRVIHSLKARGVRATDIQTSGLSIQPNYASGTPIPVGYG
ncbi:MAG: SIMPL domain-containing protein, partial [Nocardiopsaceae bacterium]|nr:SIMPL domain-containing protein [Nocardiopsaceae bacterium]